MNMENLQAREHASVQVSELIASQHTMPFVRHSLHLTTTHKLQIYKILKPKKYEFRCWRAGEVQFLSSAGWRISSFFTIFFNLGGQVQVVKTAWKGKSLGNSLSTYKKNKRNMLSYIKIKQEMKQQVMKSTRDPWSGCKSDLVVVFKRA